MVASPWGSPGADFLLSVTPRSRRLFTPLSASARWFLPQFDPDRRLPRLGPALYLERAEAITMVRLLQEHGFCLQVWTPRLTLTAAPANEKPFTPWTKPPPPGPRLSWPYEWERMSEKQLVIMHSLLNLQPNHQVITIPLDSP
jgi:hypothetical protein